MSEFFSIPLRLREMRPTQMAWCGVLLWISTVVLPEQAAQKLRLLSAFQEYQATISLCGMGCAAYLCGLLLSRIAQVFKQYSKRLCCHMKLRKTFRALTPQQWSVIHRFRAAEKSCMALPGDSFAVHSLVQSGILQDKGEPEEDDLRNRYEKLHLYTFTHDAIEHLNRHPIQTIPAPHDNESDLSPLPRTHTIALAPFGRIFLPKQHHTPRPIITHPSPPS